MSALTTIKTEKFVSRFNWDIANAKEWPNTMNSEDCKKETMDFCFEEFKNVKWKAVISGSESNFIKFSLNLDHDNLEKSILFDYKISVLLIAGKDKTYWIFWEGKKSRLKKNNVFEKEMDKKNMWKYLKGNNFEAQIKVELFKNSIITTTVQPINETEQKLKVIKDLEKMMISGQYSDLTVKIEGKTYKLHKMMLSARSKFFANYFGEYPTVSIFDFDENINQNVFDTFVTFLYTGEPKDLDNNDALQMLELSEKYEITDLKEIYESLLETRVTTENAMKMFCYSLTHNSCYGLKERAFRVLQLQYRDMGINIPNKMINKSIEEMMDFINEEVKLLEMDLKEMKLEE